MSMLTGDGWTLLENASLLARNTFRVPARAALLIDVHRTAALAEVLSYPLVQRQPLLVLGGGSNMLFTRDWPGVVLSIVAHGVDVLDDDGETARLRVAAGESWDDLVRWTLARGFVGLENLIAIPGTVGAAPIQNIGAYGREVGEFIVAVETWDREAGAVRRFETAECAFAYRDSRFKREPQRHVITAVEFRLARRGEVRADYAGVGEQLAAMGIAAPTAPQLAEAIAHVRATKLPDTARIGNAGSFFKNPIVSADAAETLRRAHPDLPAWPQAEGVKLSAGWLIEQAGFKGVRDGDAGISERHALVVVNHGHASGADLLALARRVRDGVEARFGVVLDPEPLIV